MYVTATEDVQRLTSLLGDAHAGWKAFSVSPTRVRDALGAIQPSVVVFDSSLGDVQALQRQARGQCCSRTLVINDADLSGLSQLLGGLR
jgi:hypothetical protein